MRRKPVILLLSAAAVTALAVAIIPGAFDRALKERFVGPEHVFELPDRPAHLTEQLAITKCRETLARDGLDTNAWKLVRDGRTSAPDGTSDLYFARNTKDLNQGKFTVQDETGTRRFVHVELVGDQVKSCVVIPKST